jgi:hypothetical protein
MAMTSETDGRDLRLALLEQILNGPGKATRNLRVCAFNNKDVPEPLRDLIGNIVARPPQITDADFGMAGSAGFDDDELVEMVICAAVGEANRQYEARVAALVAAAPEHGSG